MLRNRLHSRIFRRLSWALSSHHRSHTRHIIAFFLSNFFHIDFFLFTTAHFAFTRRRNWNKFDLKRENVLQLYWLLLKKTRDIEPWNYGNGLVDLLVTSEWNDAIWIRKEEKKKISEKLTATLLAWNLTKAKIEMVSNVNVQRKKAVLYRLAFNFSLASPPTLNTRAYWCCRRVKWNHNNGSEHKKWNFLSN